MRAVVLSLWDWLVEISFFRTETFLYPKPKYFEVELQISQRQVGSIEVFVSFPLLPLEFPEKPQCLSERKESERRVCQFRRQRLTTPSKIKINFHSPTSCFVPKIIRNLFATFRRYSKLHRLKSRNLFRSDQRRLRRQHPRSFLGYLPHGIKTFRSGIIERALS